MNKPRNIIFETISGSNAYGLNTPESDVDIRGVFRASITEHLSLFDPIAEVSSNSQDIKYYELKKFFNLAKDCNPNIIELLWMPGDCIKIHTEVWDRIQAKRDLFISTKAFHTFSGYAYAQIKKATGQNKLINNPITEKPKKEDFCWIIPTENFAILQSDQSPIYTYFKKAPARPISLKDLNIDLSMFHVVALEHVSNTYRLYWYGPNESKGVFRGDGMLITESIPLEDEWNKYCGLLIYNDQEYEKALRSYNQYKEWVEMRNTSRWKLQEDGKLNYDQKNMMHTFRLLYSGKNILTEGFPLIRFDGAMKNFLMDIRNGKFEYDYLIKKAEEEMTQLQELKNKTKLPRSVNAKKINNLYFESLQNIVHGVFK